MTLRQWLSSARLKRAKLVVLVLTVGLSFNVLAQTVTDSSY
jgi:hypothetical protein